ncbi:hypothetical protein [Actinoplanes awajinensis]|uniref:Uncharacterized protein n=1 Tax=Actinoplanes awajinensis subsp. mycoplanecinus TaxID=135947 RepID=A0A124G9G5_9ACTN|nr:hypothetical protein [Actinoplanes awajinensis]KUL29062.1 hypothetical protein ADL15_29720 [Actinoplanes awajinensis subsp. mycoplanecinus]
MSEPHPHESAWPRPDSSWSSGTVTASGVPPLVPPPPDPPPAAEPTGPERRRRQLMIFGGVAGLILAGGLIVLLVILFGSESNPFRERASAPTDVRPPLAQACPAPTSSASAPATEAPVVPPPATGARTVDEEAGISYRKYPAPWLTWTDVWRAGTLQVPYRVGQHFVTETYSGGEYHASILSAAIPAADNDAVSLDLECVGRQIAADVRAEYYPQPNTMEPIRDEVTTLGGRPAWVSEFRLRFRADGLTATEEYSAVAVIDVGKPSAAILYVSIPGTHKQFDYVVRDVLNSVRPL